MAATLGAMSATPSLFTKLEKLLAAASAGLYQREELVRLGLLAALAGESVFFLGPPGTAKSLVARRLKAIFQGASSFEYLMGRFSTPDEIFGPVSVKKLSEEGVYQRQTQGYMPEAEIVFLDEVWNASPPIQNALLTAMNEKLFRNGRQELPIAMRLLVGASNSLHPGDETAAFWDRFLIRVPVSPITSRELFSEFLSDFSYGPEDPVEPGLKISDKELAQLKKAAEAVTLPENILAILAGMRDRLSQLRPPSDRRWKKIAGLLRICAACQGRNEARLSDLALLEYCLWEEPEDRHELRNWLREEIHAGIGQQTAGLAANLSAIERSLAQLVDDILHSGGEQILAPAIFDGEYYALKLVDSDKEYRVWKPDGDAMLEKPASVELFSFEDGALTGSTICAVELAQPDNPWQVSIRFPDGKNATASIRTQTVRAVQAASLQSHPANSLLSAAQQAAGVPAAGRKSFEQKLQSIEKQLAEVKQELGRIASSFDDGASSHLFVPRPNGGPWTEPIEAFAVRVEQLHRALDLLLADLEG